MERLERLDDAIAALLRRSHALGADPKVTNYGGGNTSCKATGFDPVTAEDVTVLAVKGSGGDLGTLAREGLALLVLERVFALEGRFDDGTAEDALAGLLDHCHLGAPCAAPSIDTAMHAFTPAPHVDHTHPDAVIALAAAVDGPDLVEACYGGEVAWVPWRRPGFALGRELGQLCRARPGLRGIVLGGHGLVSWGATAEECQAATLSLIERAERFISERGDPEPLGPVVPERSPLPLERRHELAGTLAPLIRGLATTDGPAVARYWDDDLVLDFLSRAETPRVVPLGTSCPDHFLRTKVRPLLLDVPATAPIEEVEARLRALHAAYRAGYAAYYERYATAASPPMRGADPAIVLVPGVGMWSFGRDARAARIAGEFYRNAINVIRGAEALSAYRPIEESEKFRIEYWELEEAKLRRLPPPLPLAGRVVLVTGAGSGIGRAIARRCADAGAAVVATDIDEGGVKELASELGGLDVVLPLALDVGDPEAIEVAIRTAARTYGGLDVVVNNAGLSVSAPLADTTIENWDLQHRVMARGSFLVSQAAARVLEEQGGGGDLVYVVSKNAIAAGPDNVAYGAAKADQAHQVRLLAAELGPSGIRVNGVNPDGVVQGSGIFANGWGARRAAVYGIPEDELGSFYAARTLLKREVLPEDVAEAVLTLIDGSLALTTGLLIPVDGGNPAAFLR